ncbi:hypothetical protein K6R55_005004, partial [Escherichia coli]|nr:hypothetical protein [Escherichia coli]
HRALSEHKTLSVSWSHYPLSLPNVALIASCCGLIYAVITKRGSTTLPFGPCLSLGGIATIYLQALF